MIIYHVPREKLTGYSEDPVCDPAAITGVETQMSEQKSTTTLQGLSRQFNCEMVGTTVPASFKYLKAMLLSAIPPACNSVLYVSFHLGNRYF